MPIFTPNSSLSIAENIHDVVANDSPRRSLAPFGFVSLVEESLKEVEVYLENLLMSSIGLIPEVGAHVLFAGGKRFRPTVTLLAAQAAHFCDPVQIKLAAVGELIHTATLLHDDVIDTADFRRGRPAARLKYGNGMAVLTGDFCLARGLQAIAYSGQLKAVQSLADAVTRMAEGEIAQLDAAGDSNTDFKRYYTVIDRKTAALVAWCSSLGELVHSDYIAPLRRYGLELGYAFQITDDILDYCCDVPQLGKPRGQDVREGKWTLPLLFACELKPSFRSYVQSVFAQGPPINEDDFATILAHVTSSDAIDRSLQIAQDHAEKAKHELCNLPASVARDALAELTAYVIERSQ